jgi:hypothetical protein
MGMAHWLARTEALLADTLLDHLRRLEHRLYNYQDRLDHVFSGPHT